MRTIPNQHATWLMLALGMMVVYTIAAVYWLYLLASSGFSVRRFRRILSKA